MKHLSDYASFDAVAPGLDTWSGDSRCGEATSCPCHILGFNYMSDHVAFEECIHLRDPLDSLFADQDDWALL